MVRILFLNFQPRTLKYRLYILIPYIHCKIRILGIWDYIEGIRCTVKDMNQRVVKAQENVIAIKSLINKWNSKPLFKRINKHLTEPLLDIEGKITKWKLLR